MLFLAPKALVYEYPAVIMADKEAPLSFRVGQVYKNYGNRFFVKEEIYTEINKGLRSSANTFQKKAAAAKNVYNASKAVAEKCETV